MKTTFTAIALTVGVLAGGSAAPAFANSQATVDATAQQTQLDLQDWRNAGFDEASYTALSQDVFSDAYRERMARYQALRAERQDRR